MVDRLMFSCGKKLSVSITPGFNRPQRLLLEIMISITFESIKVAASKMKRGFLLTLFWPPGLFSIHHVDQIQFRHIKNFPQFLKSSRGDHFLVKLL